MKRSCIAGLAGALLLAGCGSSSVVGDLRYANQAPVTVVNDRRDVAEVPEENEFYKALYHIDGYWHKRLTRALEVPTPTRALNVNSMGEVPDSTWFTNRIGVRELSLEEIERGPNVSGTPEDHLPWTIVSSKVGGASPGFIIEDARGETYLLKFDIEGVPEMETGADVVVQRLLWAIGYNVPEDYVVVFDGSDLVIGEGAVKSDALGNEEPLTQAFVERQLARIDVGPKGRIRGLASKLLPGEAIGPYAREGVRDDDPNDLVPHEKRRELRGQYAFFSWLDHTDIKGDNTLDMYQPDPENPDIHYVVHYLLDFGHALGVQASKNHVLHVGYAYKFDLVDMATSVFTLGMWKRPWEGRPDPGIRGVGLFDAVHYEPATWSSYTPSYFPIFDADRFDNFWASKILIRFTPEQIQTAVRQGRYTDPRAVQYLTRVLVQRQRKTAMYWFTRVNPLDEFRVQQDGDAASLCFVDLAVRHNLERSLVSPTRYDLVGFDADGRQTGFRTRVPGTVRGEICVPGVVPSSSPDGYLILKIDTSREGLDVPGTLVHLARDPQGGALRVIGVHRL